MKVYVLMGSRTRIGRTCNETKDYIKGIYLDRESAENNAKIALENSRDFTRYDLEFSYYVVEWEAE